MWFMCSLRPAGSTPCLLPTPRRGDAVGTVCGAEPSNCTDGTFTRADVRFTGAPNFGNEEGDVLGREQYPEEQYLPSRPRLDSGFRSALTPSAGVARKLLRRWPQGAVSKSPHWPSMFATPERSWPDLRLAAVRRCRGCGASAGGNQVSRRRGFLKRSARFGNQREETPNAGWRVQFASEGGGKARRKAVAASRSAGNAAVQGSRRTPRHREDRDGSSVPRPEAWALQGCNVRSAPRSTRNAGLQRRLRAPHCGQCKGATSTPRPAVRAMQECIVRDARMHRAQCRVHRPLRAP